VRNELIKAIKDARNSPVYLRNPLQSKEALMADSKGERLYGVEEAFELSVEFPRPG
jgi:hypothetical protein